MIKAVRARLATLRWRLTLFYCGLLAVLLLASGLFVYNQLASSLRAGTERQLRDQATTLANEIGGGFMAEVLVGTNGKPGLPDKLRSFLLTERSRSPIVTYIALLDAQGHRILTNALSADDLAKLKGDDGKPRDPNSEPDPKIPDLTALAATFPGDYEAAPPPAALLAQATTAKDGTFYPATLERAGGAAPVDGLALVLALRDDSDKPVAATLPPVVGYIQIATSLADSQNALAALAALLGVGLLGTVVLAGLLGLPLARLGLRPLTAMTATATRIGGGDLTQRVQVPTRAGEGDEVQQLALAFNTMLDQIETAFAAQQESEARTRRFAADASHELRSPLTVLGGYLDVLQMGAKDDPAQADRILGAMQRENDRLGRLVIDLLLLTRIDSDGAAHLQCVPLLLAEVVTRAADNMCLLAGSRTLRVMVVPAAAAIGLLGDADHLYRVLVNLLDNAIRHTAPSGRITLALDLAPGPGDGSAGWLRLQISDDGCGIAPADLPYIFDRFYRADPSRARQTGNAGLGLAIAKSIVEAHGGSITVASTPGTGTCFTLLLPPGPAPAFTPALFSANSQPALRAPQV